ncbi:hypothetical protein [Aeromonas veronii]|uniref:hypothetical protein n=1 Tax=Aeromonas veronii TaxID=654 RepID=UPI0032F051B2
MPNADSKGPIQTTGSECKLGGSEGGGDGEGGGNVDPSLPFPNQISPIAVGGAYQEGTTAALKQIDSDLRWFAIKSHEQGKETLATFNAFGKDLMKVTDALTTQSNSFEEYGKTQFSMLTSLVKTQDTLQQLTNCVVNPFNNGCDHLGGSGGGGSSSSDTAAIKGMMQTAMGWWGGTPGNLSAINSNLTGISNSISPMFPMLEHFNKQQTNLQTQMAGDLSAIKESLGNGQGSGGGVDIDYSKMPGAAGNPLQIAGAEYESGLCQEGDNCAFNLANINKQYDESKDALKKAYKDIRTEVADTFKFQLNGSGAAPKCFEMFSLFGKSYSVCPSVGGYWETLAAIMMFIFYFIALMIVARR